MSLSLNQAQDIVQKLSNEQLMHTYTSGTIPQFVVFSEMQRRQSMANANAKMPTQTVAEKMVGSNPEASGIGSMMPQQPPQMAAKGGITRSSPLDMGYSEELPPEAKKILTMRLKQMRELEEPDYNPQYAAEGGKLEASIPPADETGGKPNSREIADMLLHPVKMVESGGRQSAVSPKGATGVMQIMPNTGPEAARLAGLKWDPKKFKMDEEYNTKLGHAYLASMLDRFGDTEKALAAYNWGPTNLSNAIDKANKTGTDWKSYLPTETSNYLGKVLGSRQAMLPPRQDPEGADTQVPEYSKPYTDHNWAGFKTHDPTIYRNVNQYPYSSMGIDSLRDAFSAANKVQKMRFSDGGPIYLQAGGTGDESSAVGQVRKTPFGLEMTMPNGETIILPPGMNPEDAKRMFQRTPTSTSSDKPSVPSVPPGQGSQFPAEKVYQGTKTMLGNMWDSLPSAQSVGKFFTGLSDPKKQLEGGRDPTPAAPYMAKVGLPGIGDDESYVEEEPKSSIFSRAWDRLDTGIGTFLAGTDDQREMQALVEERDKYSTGLFEKTTESERRAREAKIKEIDAKIEALKNKNKLPESGIKTVPAGSPSMNDVPTIPLQGMPSSQPPSAPSPSAKAPPSPQKQVAGNVGAGAGSKTASEDMSFKSVMDQVKQAIGSEVPNELKEQMIEHKKNIASMQNDKVVDALFAAAKTLAGQRVGQQNFGDAVANAGIAAQEAQKRIYKAEDDMRKYRGELLRAQDTNNYQAANIAMNRIIQADRDKKALEVAVMQANKAMQLELHRDKQLNEAKRKDNLNARIAEYKQLTAGGSINRMTMTPQDVARAEWLQSEIDRLSNVDIELSSKGQATTTLAPNVYNLQTKKIEPRKS